MRRAVITGIGPVTPVGIGKEAFWKGIRSGESAVKRISAFDVTRLKSQLAAEVRGFDPEDYLDPIKAKKLDRYAQFSVVAARLALHDAGIDLGKENMSGVGVAIGSALGGFGFAQQQAHDFHEKGMSAASPIPTMMAFCGSGSCNIAFDVGAMGPVVANSNGCASGAIALGEALGFIRRGEANIMLAGGAEAPLYPMCFAAFAQLHTMSCRNNEPQKACRPFDARRDGFVMGEGAAIMVVEELHHALNRGARIYAEITGLGITNDAYHSHFPLPDGTQAARAMQIAIDAAGLRPSEVDYINAHGSSIPINDRTETLAIKKAFGEQVRDVVISSTKGHHAHPLGASGAIEAAVCALAMERSFIPPTLNLDCPDIDCDLDYTPNKGRARDVSALISNSFGFGGINASLVMRKIKLSIKCA